MTSEFATVWKAVIENVGPMNARRRRDSPSYGGHRQRFQLALSPLVSTHHSLPSLREGRATARGGLLLVRCSLFRCLDTLACPRPSPLVTSRPSRREGEISTIPLVLRSVETNALRESRPLRAGEGNPVCENSRHPSIGQFRPCLAQRAFDAAVPKPNLSIFLGKNGRI